MKTSLPATLDTITNGYVNTVAVVAHAEWDSNKFYRTLVDNTPSEDTSGYDIEKFPIESITKTNRPRAGINKAIVNQATVESGNHTVVPAKRYYMSTSDDLYTYWQSPEKSNAAGVMANCAPQVTYVNETNDNPVVIQVNKIEFTVENSYSYPNAYTVQIKTSAAGSWTTVATNVAIPTDGFVELWYNGSAWTTTKTLGFATGVCAVRLVVTGMAIPSLLRTVSVKTTNTSATITAAGGGFTAADVGATVSGAGIPAGATIVSINDYYTTANDSQGVPVRTYWTDAVLSAAATATNTSVNVNVSVTSTGAYFNLIELGTSLVLDLSPDVINTSDSFTMGEADFLTPLGNISSNTGTLSLMNENDKYSNDNPASPLYGMLDRGVKFTCWYAYGADRVQEFEFYSDTWDEEIDQTVVALTDNTKFFMDTKPPVVLYRDIPVQEAVWRICDIIGFTNYQVSTVSTAPSSMIDIFWTDGEKTAWETFSDLAKATQTAIYFDAYGKLQVKTRDAAWNDAKPYSYSFIKTTVAGGQPANIISINNDTKYEANKVAINWQPTGFSEKKDNVTPFEVVWEPDGDVVLRSSELLKSLLVADTIITLGRKDGSTWPPEGIMNIDGEWIAYKGKEYINYANGTRQTSWVKSQEEQNKLDDLTPGSQLHLNSYTGRLQVKQRGLYNTVASDHLIDLANWTKARRRNYTTTTSPCTGISLNAGASTVTLQSPSTANLKDYTYLHHGSNLNIGYKNIGARLRVNKTSHRDKVGGICFNVDGPIGTGYFVEVTASAKVKRATQNEIMFYSMKADGSKKYFGGEQITLKDASKTNKNNAKTKVAIGQEVLVTQGVMLDLDIDFSIAGNGDHLVAIYVNGQFLFSATVPVAGGWQHAKAERYALYVRGHSSLNFEHTYAIDITDHPGLDDEPFYDRILGGFYSNQSTDWQYDTHIVRRKVKKKWTKRAQRYKQRFFDDFGPWVHEIREFDVKYTSDLPSLQSKLYYSNTSRAVALDFWTTPKAGHFTIANISRQNAILNGDEDIGGGNVINHKLFVYGRPVIQKDTQTVNKTDDWALRRRGVIDVEYDSPWIQNESEANAFADWLTTHWSRSDSSLSIEVFGNPLIELTDVVHVKFDNIDDDYYVVGIESGFENGVNTTLDLRRVTKPL